MTMTMTEQRHGLKVARQSFRVSSATHREAIDVTPQVRDAVRDAAVSSGVVIANCLHTTCAVIIEEPRQELIEHLVRLIGGLVDDDARYKHNDPRLSDCERGNAAAHLRATLLGHGVAVAVMDGELVLPGAQSIFLAEWDGPRPRQMHIQTMGV